jgi:bifunctional UDP-N-acetylglucosamine pyrophosphorylase/glucosamine-1-phosphate N-acetyltransferase
MNDTVALVLAAGKGTRMYSDTPKVLHPICGRPMLSYVLETLEQLDLDRIVVVVGHQAERVRDAFAVSQVEWVVQPEQLGTAHAVHCALPQLASFDGAVLICCGDTPLLTAATLRTVMKGHVMGDAGLSVLTMKLEQPGNYGRIIRNSQREVVAIIEAKDANDQERDIREVNTGIYCASSDLLRTVIAKIDNTNAQGEYYLTDLVQRAKEAGWKVQALAASDPTEFQGVNSKEELEAAERAIAQRME